jgi:hypothetical protein
VTQHSGNTEHRVRQDSKSKNLEVREDATLSRRPAQRWCPRGITKMIRQRESAEKKEEEERDCWFNHLWLMTRPEQTWREND